MVSDRRLALLDLIEPCSQQSPLFWTAAVLFVNRPAAFLDATLPPRRPPGCPPGHRQAVENPRGVRVRIMTEQARSTTDYQIASEQFDIASEIMGLREELRVLLKTPFREMRVAVPIRRDDGTG